MTVPELISLATNQLTHKSQLRTAAERLGDVAQLAQLDADIAETQATLDALRAIPAG